ncbi:hypothetical protein [Streptomyces canus]|uniref:hypothetical protein n=1 Tax=Streptomyces canus TaxID=58343 RepID=UPI00224D52E6|nr:hypothetical protein [Streptomyces canus]MCX4862408.1 hypothetical protein [Streptomyces canus]
MGVLVLEQVGSAPQQVVADLSRPAQFVAIAVGGGLDDVGVQGGEALQVVAGGVVFDAADVCAGPFVEPVGQVLGEQRGEQHRWQHEVGGDVAPEGEQGGEETDGPDGGGGEPQGGGARGGQSDAVGGAPGQPTHGQPLRKRRARGEDTDLRGDFGHGAVAGNAPAQPAPSRALVHERRFTCAGAYPLAADMAGAQGA